MIESRCMAGWLIHVNKFELHLVHVCTHHVHYSFTSCLPRIFWLWFRLVDHLIPTLPPAVVLIRFCCLACYCNHRCHYHHRTVVLVRCSWLALLLSPPLLPSRSLSLNNALHHENFRPSDDDCSNGGDSRASQEQRTRTTVR